MTKDTTTAPEIAVTDYPLAILWTWENHHKALGFIADVDRALAAKDALIERKQAELDALKGDHRALGMERGDHETNAGVFRESVEHWCEVHDMPMPPEPAEPAVMSAPDPGPLEVAVTRMADVRVANGQQETREQRAVEPADADPLVPLPPNVVDARPETTVPDETTDEQGDGDE